MVTKPTEPPLYYSYTLAPAGFGCDGGFLNTVEQLAAADHHTWRTDRHPDAKTDERAYRAGARTPLPCCHR